MALSLQAHLEAGQSELDVIAREILRCDRPIIILSGAVGSGKTTLTQALLHAWRNHQVLESGAKLALESNVKSRADSALASPLDFALDSGAPAPADSGAYSAQYATSPTFSLMHDYGGMYHYDLYNRPAQELLELGLLEWLGESGLHCVEWGEALVDLLLESGFSCMVVKIIAPDTQEHRIYELYA